jgi:hypothetical protein
VFPEDSTQFASQKIRFPASRPADVSYCSDSQLSKAPAVQKMCHTILTHIRLKHHPSRRRGFASRPSSVSRSFELLQLAFVRTIQQPIRTIQQPVRTTLSVRPKLQDFFRKHRYRKIFALIHKSSIAIQIQKQTTVIMVRTCVYQIWKLRASDQPSGRPSSWSGRAKPLYGNYLQQTCDRPNDKATFSGRGSQTGKIFSEIFGISVAQLSVRTDSDHRPDGAQFYQARHSFELSAYK